MKLAKRDVDGLPIAFDRELDTLKRKLVVWSPSDGSTAELCRALTSEERSNLQARADALDGALAPHSEDDRERINSALTAMFAGFRQMRQSGEDMEATITIARAVLREFPLWAIEKACLTIARHDAGLDPCWPPNDAQIVKVVRATIKLRKQALDDARLVLSAAVRQEARRTSEQQLKVDRQIRDTRWAIRGRASSGVLATIGEYGVSAKGKWR